MASCGEATRLDSIEVAIGSCSVPHRYRHTVRTWQAGLDEFGIQTGTSVPGSNSFLQFRDPIGRYIPGLKGNDHFASPMPFPWNLLIARILVLQHGSCWCDTCIS